MRAINHHNYLHIAIMYYHCNDHYQDIMIKIISIIIIILYHCHHHSDGAHLKPLSQFQRWENEKMNVTHIITLDVLTNLTASLENGSRLTIEEGEVV